MKTPRILSLFALCSAAFVATLPAVEAIPQEMPSQAEMWRMLQAQQQQIETLTALVQANQQEVASAKVEVATAKAEASSARAEVKATQQQVEATTLAVEEIGASSFGAPGWWENTSVGGYGELHANFYGNADNEIDFHRFVLFFNHEYNDWITLYSELELEHSLVKDTADGSNSGEVELEQAFVRLDWTDQFSTDVGVFLMPIGILNETHEPNTFYGIERNNIESRIIPSTWWEAGVKGSYRMGNGLAFDAAITSGLDVDATGVIRSGRQKVSKAVNEEAAVITRATYTGIAGLEVGASVFYQDDLAQTADDVDISGLLSEAHIDYSNGGFRIRALYARWDLSGTLASEAEEQYGYYIEPSYRWNISERYGDLGVYIRYSDYEYYTGKMLSQNEIYEIGVNYWPTPNVVLKADLQDISNSDQMSSKGATAFNLGFGYQF